MVTSPDSFFSREYSANFVITDEGREALHRNLVINEGRDAIHDSVQWTYQNGTLECNIRTGHTRPIARDATALSRACSRTQIQNNGVDFGSFSLNPIAFFSSGLPPSAPIVNLGEQKKFDWYGGCHRCYQFSMLFGNVSNTIGNIESEEDFEKYKMQFVDHYNEKHKDLYEWRKKKIGEKPITSQKNIDSLKDKIPYQTSISSMSFFPVPWNADDTFTAESINGVDVARTPQTSVIMTVEDDHIITTLEASGRISPADQKRLEKKYGRTLIQDAIKKYRVNLLTRNGFRMGRAPRREPFGRSLFHSLNNRRPVDSSLQ